MTPDRGRRGTPGKGGEATGRGPAATRRLGLLVFGIAFVVLFAIVAIAEGIGDPSVPDGSVAVVEDAPGDSGEVTQEELDHAVELAAKQAGEQKAPKAGTPKYEELAETAMNSLFEGIWLEGLAAEEGLDEVSDREIAKERRKLIQQSFPTAKEYKEFLKESGFDSDDIDERVRLQILSNRLQEWLKENAPKPTQREIENYYEAAKATQFTQKPSRDIRLIVNKDRDKAKEAREALATDNTAKNWKAVAKKYSEDPATKANGGLQQGVQEGTLEEPLDKQVFNAPEGIIEGPVDAQRGFTVFEVIKQTPEEIQGLEAVGAQIESTLTQRVEQEYFTAFVAAFSATWKQRTFCAEGYVTERCANFEGDGRPQGAPEGCYEADPKEAPEACPAPVFQLMPALPGTVTPLEPQGKQLPQRPRLTDEEKEEAAGGLEGLPPGVAPPTGGAPPPEAPPAESE